MPSLGEVGVPGAAAPLLYELVVKCGLVLLVVAPCKVLLLQDPSWQPQNEQKSQQHP